jgi:hypothetical protein
MIRSTTLPPSHNNRHGIDHPKALILMVIGTKAIRRKHRCSGVSARPAKRSTRHGSVRQNRPGARGRRAHGPRVVGQLDNRPIRRRRRRRRARGGLGRSRAVRPARKGAGHGPLAAGSEGRSRVRLRVVLDSLPNEPPPKTGALFVSSRIGCKAMSQRRNFAGAAPPPEPIERDDRRSRRPNRVRPPAILLFRHRRNR